VIPALLVKVLLGVSYRVASRDRGMVRDAWQGHLFALRKSEWLLPAPLKEIDRPDLEEGHSMATGEARMRIDDPEAVKTEWLGRLGSLVDEIERWARVSGWRTRRIAKTVNERRLGTYRVPVLLMEKDTVEVVLNPVARFVPGADGAVDLYAAPAYDDIASLYFEGDHWVVHYGSRPDPLATQSVVEITPHRFAEQTIRAILDAMAVNG
jgi:hypothetical protein